MPKLFAKVLARSSNTNSFGLREHVIVFSTGHTFKACRSAYVPDAEEYAIDSVFGLYLDDRDFSHMGDAGITQLVVRGFELVSKVPSCPPSILKKIDFSQK